MSKRCWEREENSKRKKSYSCNEFGWELFDGANVYKQRPNHNDASHTPCHPPLLQCIHPRLTNLVWQILLRQLVPRLKVNDATDHTLIDDFWQLSSRARRHVFAWATYMREQITIMMTAKLAYIPIINTKKCILFINSKRDPMLVSVKAQQSQCMYPHKVFNICEDIWDIIYVIERWALCLFGKRATLSTHWKWLKYISWQWPQCLPGVRGKVRHYLLSGQRDTIAIEERGHTICQGNRATISIRAKGHKLCLGKRNKTSVRAKELQYISRQRDTNSVWGKGTQNLSQ